LTYGPGWATNEAFDDGEALYAAVCEHGLEGVVAKRLRDPYVPGSRYWTKRKNPNYWRRDAEIEAMQRSWQRRAHAEAVGGLAPRG
jgi:ATP-dependent DNA ligase